MAMARARLDWNRTSSLMAMLAGAFFRRKGGGRFTPRDFSPFATRAGAPRAKVSVLRDLWVKTK